MISSVCTLFEGHYHYGVAALSSSLYKNGFTGAIYAGYRGVLPEWCAAARENNSLDWPQAKTLTLFKDLQIHFLPLDTDYHFTNYKPDFMIRLIEGPAQNAEAMFYFDPDIVITAPWSCFEEWVDCGVALCEDVNSPLAENHPRRIAWRKFYRDKGYTLRFKEGIYANGGFVGLRVKHKQFLKCWQHMQEGMAPNIGGLSRSALRGPAIPIEARGPFAPFGKTDQDALNATVEAWDDEVSFVGKEAMGFASGLALMPHALGHPKPWQWKPISKAIGGQPPRLVDREYWNVVNKYVVTHPNFLVSGTKNFHIDGCFYRPVLQKRCQRRNLLDKPN